VIEELLSFDAEGPQLFFFYCDYQEAEKRDPSMLLQSILFEMIERIGKAKKLPLPSTIVATIKRCSLTKSVDMSSLQVLICGLAKELNDVFLVLDALDECNNRTELLYVLRNLSTCMRLFVTSRDEQDIRTSFGGYVKHQIWIQQSDTQEDLEAFVNQQIQERLHARFLHLVPKVRQVIVDEAHGMYAENLRNVVFGVDVLSVIRQVSLGLSTASTYFRQENRKRHNESTQQSSDWTGTDLFTVS
jgi:pheromone shutdown protein TraB